MGANPFQAAPPAFQWPASKETHAGESSSVSWGAPKAEGSTKTLTEKPAAWANPFQAAPPAFRWPASKEIHGGESSSSVAAPKPVSSFKVETSPASGVLFAAAAKQPRSQI